MKFYVWPSLYFNSKISGTVIAVANSVEEVVEILLTGNIPNKFIVTERLLVKLQNSPYQVYSLQDDNGNPRPLGLLEQMDTHKACSVITKE